MATGKYKPKGVWGKRVDWSCDHCGLEKQVRPAEAKQRFCSRKCYAADKISQRNSYVCKGCGQEFWRKKRGKDSLEYCSKKCSGAHKRKHDAHVAVWSRQIASVPDAVKQERSALRAVAAKIRSRTGTCSHCGDSFIRLKVYARFCSSSCESSSREQTRLRYKSSEVYKSARRAAKAKRRAVLRSVQADSIDPIKVFERDGWTCHICHGKTLKSERGTYDDRAPELDHIVSLADGGPHTWSNVACSCRRCNLEKGARSLGQLGLPMAV